MLVPPTDPFFGSILHGWWKVARLVPSPSYEGVAEGGGGGGFAAGRVLTATPED